MGKRSSKNDNPISDSPDSNKNILNNVTKEDNIILERIKELANVLRLKHGLTTKDILYLTDDKEVLIPISIFMKKLSALESVVKYLKEELQLSYHQIGILLNRDERNVWSTYKNVSKKHPAKFVITSSKYFIPASIFQNELGALENIALYMKNSLNLTYHQIAVLLDRDDRTIWTMCNRKKK